MSLVFTIYNSNRKSLKFTFLIICIILGKTLISRGIQLEVCDKFIIQFTKVLIGVSDMHPFYYIELIPTTLEFCVFYCFTEAGQSFTFERFIIQCLNLLKGMLILDKYRPSAGINNYLFIMCKFMNIIN